MGNLCFYLSAFHPVSRSVQIKHSYLIQVSSVFIAHANILHILNGQKATCVFC